jgi:hypothetical protein
MLGSKLFLVKRGNSLGQSHSNTEEGNISIWDEPARTPERRGFSLNGLVIQLSTEKDYGNFYSQKILIFFRC